MRWMGWDGMGWDGGLVLGWGGVGQEKVGWGMMGWDGVMRACFCRMGADDGAKCVCAGAGGMVRGGGEHPSLVAHASWSPPTLSERECAAALQSRRSEAAPKMGVSSARKEALSLVAPSVSTSLPCRQTKWPVRVAGKEHLMRALHHTAPHHITPRRTAPHRAAPYPTAPHRTEPHCRTAPNPTPPHHTASAMPGQT